RARPRPRARSSRAHPARPWLRPHPPHAPLPGPRLPPHGRARGAGEEDPGVMADLHALEENGYAIVPEVIDPSEIDPLLAELEAHVAAAGAEGQAGLRNAGQQLATVRAMRAHPRLVGLASEILGRPALVVRTLLFDKTPGA